MNKFYFPVLCLLILGLTYPLNVSYGKQDSSKKVRMCYFDLSTISGSMESELPRKWQKRTNEQIELVNYYPEGTKKTIRSAFKDMVQENNNENKKCDGLIISGHHTGNSHGDKSQYLEKLSLKFIEELSCKEEYKGFFNNIKSLWLHGSRTLNGVVRGAGKVDAKTKNYIKEDEDGSDNFHPQFIKIINLAFSATLNENTAFHSRYLRSFPNANLFGFSNEAPTNKQRILSSGFWDDVLDAIVGMAKEEEAKAKENAETNSIIDFASVISSSDICKTHSDVWTARATLQPDTTRAFVPVNHIDKKIRELGCKLINIKAKLEANPKDTKGILRKDLMKTFDEIFKFIDEKNPNGTNKTEEEKNKIFHLLFHNIFESYTMAQDINKTNKNSGLLSALKSKFIENKRFKGILEKHMKSEVAGSLRKIDYINFYKDLYGSKTKEVNEAILTHITEINKALTTKSDEYDKTFAVARIEQLRQYDLLTHADIENFIKNFPQEKNQFNKPIKHRLAYSSYVKSQDEDKLDELLAITLNNDATIPTEALKNNDFNTLNKLIEKAKEKDLDNVKRSIQQGVINNVAYGNSPKTQVAKLESYMKQSDNESIKTAILYASSDIALSNNTYMNETEAGQNADAYKEIVKAHKNFLKKMKRNYSALPEGVQSVLEILEPN